MDSGCVGVAELTKDVHEDKGMKQCFVFDFNPPVQTKPQAGHLSNDNGWAGDRSAYVGVNII